MVCFLPPPPHNKKKKKKKKNRYFFDKYPADISEDTAGIVASLFGLMNLFARALGGMLSDRLNRRYGLAGRYWTQFGTLLVEGAIIVGFSRVDTLASSIVLLILFSTAVQMAEGATFGLVPYVAPQATGSVSGIVGAGGSIGAIAWGVLFRFGPNDQDDVLLIIGAVVMAIAALTPLIRLKHHHVWQCFAIEHPH